MGQKRNGGHLTTPSTWPGKGTRGAVAELIFIFFTKTVLPFHSYEIMMHSQQTNRDLCKFTLKDQFQFLALCASEEGLSQSFLLQFIANNASGNISLNYKRRPMSQSKENFSGKISWNYKRGPMSQSKGNFSGNISWKY